MIKVFQAKDTYFASNGDKIINPYKAIVYKEDNGDYYCEVEAQIELLDYLKQDMILCVQTPWGWQAFRCDKPQRSGNKIRVKAWHLYYDTENYVVAEENIVNESCQAALNQLKGGCDSTLPFSVVSDIANTGSLHCKHQSFAEAVNGVLEVWGGHLDRDNFNIGIKSTIGQDRGVTLAYGKNIKEITAEENWDNVCTKIFPVGRNEVTIGFLTSSVQYDLPYTKVVEFSQDIEQLEGEEDAAYTERLQADLMEQATQYLADHAHPEVNYKLKAHLQEVADVGDTIWVKHPKCQVDVETHVISVKWDAIKGEYKEIEFGNFRKKLSGLNSIVTAEIKKAEKTTESFVNEELRKATDKIMGVFGNSYVIYDGDKILVVDKLPKEEAKNVIRINSAGIGFSSDGINGTFNSAWLIDGTFDAQQVNVINLSADAIVSGNIDANKVTLLNLEVGKNVAMGDEATISWGQVTDHPEIINADAVTVITRNAISTALIRADQVQAGSFYMTGGSIDISAYGSSDKILLKDLSNSVTVRLGTNGFAILSGSAAQYIDRDSSQLYNLNVFGSCWLPDGTVCNAFAPASHSHSEYYESGDTIHANYLYIASLGSASQQALYCSTNSGIVGTDSSSERYKNSIADVTDEMLDPHRLYDLPVRQFKWNEGHFDEAEKYNYDTVNVGFIAEEVAEHYPYAAVISKGQIESWEVRRILPPMLSLIQEQKKEIDALKERVEALEKKGAV